MARTGRPSWEPTDEQRTLVQTMSGYGIKQQDIAQMVGVSWPTLHKKFRVELDTGAAKANTSVTESLFKLTQKAPHQTRLQACMFWLKCRAGWIESQRIEIVRPVAEMETAEIEARLQIERAGQRDGKVVRLRPAR